MILLSKLAVKLREHLHNPLAPGINTLLDGTPLLILPVERVPGLANYVGIGRTSARGNTLVNTIYQILW
jgi:hypothetical protein